MALSADLIITAKQLAQLHERRPRQSDLRCAVSSAYYALFHGLAEVTADRFVGATPTARQSTAWCRVYRDLNHNEVKKACRSAGQIGGSNHLHILPVVALVFRNYGIRRITTQMPGSNTVLWWIV